MSKRHIPEAHAAHPNVTPLIDVVMVLIVFFMLVARIGVSSGADETIKVPKTILGIEIKDLGNTLTLNVKPLSKDRREEQVARPIVTALVPGPGGGPPTVTELKVEGEKDNTQLIRTLKYFRYGKNLVPGGSGPDADNEEFKVIIRGDKDMEYQALEIVLHACAAAHVKSVNFNTEKVVERQAVAAN